MNRPAVSVMIRKQVKHRIPIGLFVLVGFGWLGAEAQTWDGTLRSIRAEFPRVRQLAVAELADWIADTNRMQPFLVDAREPAEYEVSHLRGAIRATSVVALRGILGTNARPIVVYCSVGYRSSALVEELRQAGVTNAMNLEGSIFAWANAGHPVYHHATLVRAVHPFDARWGKLLDAALRANKPVPERTERQALPQPADKTPNEDRVLQNDLAAPSPH